MPIIINETAVSAKEKRYIEEQKRIRAEARRLVSNANKRLKRLEDNNLLESPAYKQWIENGEQKFSVKGKYGDELRQEIARMEHFMKLKTSTISGAKDYFDNVAKAIDMPINEYHRNDYNQLQLELKTFFDVAEKVKEFLLNSKQVSVAIGYSKVFEEVSNYVEQYSNNLGELQYKIKEIADKLIQENMISNEKDFYTSWIEKIRTLKEQGE